MSTNNSRVAGMLGLSDKDLLLIFTAGVIGEIVLEIFAWVVVPEIAGRPMRPDILVSDLARSLAGIEMWRPLAIGIHLALGVAVFPLIYLKLRRAFSGLPWILVASLVGLALWAIAQTTLAPLAGRPFMLGFDPTWGFNTYTWSSLIAHALLMVVIAAVYERLARRFADL